MKSSTFQTKSLEISYPDLLLTKGSGDAFVLYKYEPLINLVFLLLIRCLLKRLSFCNENSCCFSDFCEICGQLEGLLEGLLYLCSL